MGCYITHFVADTAAKNVTKVKNAVYFSFGFGFTALSRLFHLLRADRKSEVGENRNTRKKNKKTHVTRARSEPRNSIHSPFSDTHEITVENW